MANNSNNPGPTPGNFPAPQPNILWPIYGDELANTLNGSSKNEAIYGYGGDDIINAGGGADQVYGLPEPP
jgi:Ca2+-binding RTX toxin-like protein